ncbi:UPF0711 protein C18orf21 homolog [Corythoichthys intestinalis]|uniref:UPF0711 protein C18orf21 homolog n=1 Tax=Corythoichthys intestinalis TaxID=161448 RepID=UPI0025A5A143|nr:UPF0711 protein C18orf21 homolog [Corythoichthys intestinalis]XP_061808263.1 UPF0711 protein C18orf21 homolog [Nerophis lumbriciformis]
MNSHEQNLSDSFRLNASMLFQESCPEESRYLLEQYFTCLEKNSPESFASLDKTSVCQYCFQSLRPDNHHVRLRPKRRPSIRVQRLLRQMAQGRGLTLMQKRILRRFSTSSSVLMATCHTCNKTTRYRGMNRDYLSTFYTPGSSSKHKTPMPANRTLSASKTKTPSKDKTPHRTPRSSSSTPGSKSSTTPSNKTPSKAKNWVVKRLSKILMREDKPDSNKGSLKDFLSSL